LKIPDITIQQLLEAGVHFGHHKKRWNPKMEKYIFGTRNNIHIIDLRITLPLLNKSLEALFNIISKSGKILFVGTKKQSSVLVETIANETNNYFITKRWFGGTLTNWKTISNSIKRLESIEKRIHEEQQKLSKKELLTLSREKEKLNNAIGGIRNMSNLPNLLIVLDTVKDRIAVKEAVKLNIPVMGIIDTNSDPDLINFPIPGNDDAIRSIDLYINLFKETILNAKKTIKENIDIGESVNPPKEKISSNEMKNSSSEKKKSNFKKIKKVDLGKNKTSIKKNTNTNKK
tara:strand:- start:67722 stop:68585 length:864 start_codon:yes stop_codon:yes gene_type:complete